MRSTTSDARANPMARVTAFPLLQIWQAVESKVPFRARMTTASGHRACSVVVLHRVKSGTDDKNSAVGSTATCSIPVPDLSQVRHYTCRHAFSKIVGTNRTLASETLGLC